MTLSFPPLPDLPVSAVLPEVAAALGERGRAVLVAPPGAGKTTLVPLHLLGESWTGSGRIILVEPRRLAARAAARRMADIIGETVGETIGWRMRLDTKVSARTRIEVVTEGVFTRMILSDPELSGIAVVLFDEFHERSLDGDFGLALALDAASALREDLRLLVMSATLDGARVADLLGSGEAPAPVVESAGRAFPVDVRYRDRSGTEAVEDAVVRCVRDVLADETGSLLVFLPGRREIERVADQLRQFVPADVTIAPLYGAMEGAAQDLAVRPAPAGIRKVVLATSIAETSLTIDGVRVVIDAGFRRQPVFEPSTGLSRLSTVRVSRAGADQRAGRAGRTAPGIAIRLWREAQTTALEPFDPPEMLATDLSGLLLDCAAWGVADPRELAFLDPPPESSLAEARALLRELGALDGDHRLTPTGEAMRRLPLPPRLAKMVVGAGEVRLAAAELAVLLTEPGLGGDDTDLAERWRRLRGDRGQRAKGALALAARIARQARDSAPAAQSDETTSGEAGALVALAYPDRVAIARGAKGSFVLANGRGGVLDALSPLAREAAIVVAELQGQARAARILSAAALTPDAFASILAARSISEDVVQFDRSSRAVRARRITRLGKAIVAEAPLPVMAGEAAERALAEGIRMLGFGALPLARDEERLLRRLRFLASTDKDGTDGWSDLSDQALLDRLEDWLLPFIPGTFAVADIPSHRIGEALSALMPAHLTGRLDELAPSHFTAPTGSRVPIRYEEEQPVLSIRVQELFGLTRHPAIAGGRLPLTVELLSPAQRPIQVTRDLPGFWAGSWAGVRADLRGRYPRHEWPEDPAAAAPTSRAKPRS